MARLTPAEKQKRYRERLSQDKLQQSRLKNAIREKSRRCNRDEKTRANERKNTVLRMRKYREKNSTKVYSTNQSMQRALNRATLNLPKSPRKKRVIIEKLAVQHGILTLSRVRTESENLKMIEDFYCSDLVSRQLPGRKDSIVVQRGDSKKKL